MFSDVFSVPFWQKAKRQTEKITKTFFIKIKKGLMARLVSNQKFPF